MAGFIGFLGFVFPNWTVAVIWLLWVAWGAGMGYYFAIGLEEIDQCGTERSTEK